MLASSIFQGFGTGWPGVLCRGTRWLTVKLQMSSHSVFVIAIAFVISWCFHSRLIPPSSHGKYVVSICVSTVLFSVTLPGGWLPLTGLSWLVVCHGLTCVQLGGTNGSTLLLGTTPQAHVLLISLNRLTRLLRLISLSHWATELLFSLTFTFCGQSDLGPFFVP